MNICYLTGLNIDEKNKSLEHIIPNALGGKLKSEYVLTHESNQKLNVDIDVEFNKIFEIYHQRLNLKKDRNKKVGIKGFHAEHDQNIIVKDGRCYPQKPLYDSKTKTVYASTNKVAKQYIAFLKKNDELNEEDIIISKDMAGNIEFKFGFNNELFKKGLAKIATGFATLRGIPRNNLCSVIDLEYKKFRNEIIVAPFLPPTNPESYFEENIHLSENYPTHSIVLYGNSSERFLYCYVELFSTFQYFVVLDEKYDGKNIYETYFYNLYSANEISYREYASSIPNAQWLKKELPEFYRKYPKYYVQSMNNNVLSAPDLLKGYIFFKANMLSSYVNFINIESKIKKLQLSNTSG